MTRTKGAVVLVAAACLATPLKATEPSVPVKICVQADFDHRQRFTELLTAAYARDFSAFRHVNGQGRYDFPPKFVTLSYGLLETGLAFADWSGSERKDEMVPVIDRWLPLYAAERTKFDGFSMFFTRVRRSVWNEYAGEYQPRTNDYLLYFDEGCDLEMIQETKMPYWVGAKNG